MKSCMAKRHPLAFATAIALGVSTTVIADDTASSVHGNINLPSNASAENAVVTIVHEASGLRRSGRVTAAGDYSIRGLRVGGPYKIIVDTVAYDDKIIEGVFLGQGSNDLDDISIRANVGIEEVMVVGSASALVAAGSNAFDEDQIARSASIARDLKDTVKRDPFAVIGTGDNLSMSIAGANPKFNSFVVDGIKQNDDFGLEANGYPTLRSPISLDAVESVSVNTSPMSVKYGGFTGGQVNVTVKSGTNDVDGSVFYEYSSDSMAGDYVPLEYEETTWGASVGFPILQDKVFGFLSYEYYDSPQSAEYGPSGAPGYSADQQAGVSVEDLERIEQIANDVYGLSDIGSYNASPVEEDEKILAKFDWYINDYHRAAFTYQHTVGNQTKNLTNYNDGDLKLSSNWYNEEQTLDTYAFNFYSQWTENFDTDIKIGYKDSSKANNPITDLGIGQVSVHNGSRDAVIFGTERYRQANELSNENLELRLDATYLMNDHEILFGAVYNNLDIFNLFAADAMGTWEFDSIEDFENGIVGDFDFSNTASGDINEAAANFEMNTLTLFIEDSWMVNDQLEMTVGLRYEQISMPDSPAFNQNFYDRYGYANTETFDGKDVILPRIGFVYEVSESTEISGGVGRFSGGYPNVWMSNSYQNDGLTLLSLYSGWDQEEWGTPDFANVPQGAVDALPAGDGTVNALDPDFDIPTDWRYLIEVDHYFDAPYIGSDWLFNTKIEYRQRENDVAWQELVRTTGDVTVQDDGRVTYDPPSNRTDFLLTNASEDGSALNAAFSLAKDWDSVSFYTAYTYSDVQEGNLGGSSRAVSNYQYPVVQYDRNATTVGNGGYMTEHRFTMSLDWTKQFFAGLDTSVSMFLDIHSGNPMSWVLGSYRMDGFGDQTSLDDSDAYLPYIPTGADDPLVNYGGGLDYETFMAAVHEVGLGQYQGQIIPKGTDTQPWIQSLDLHFSQEIPGFTDDQKGLVYFDIQNVLNLLNDEWGHVEYQSFGTKILVDSTFDPETGVYTYSVPYGQDGIETDTSNSISAKQSNWRMKLGVRYSF